jgi:hypothetical protein
MVGIRRSFHKPFSRSINKSLSNGIDVISRRALATVFEWITAANAVRLIRLTACDPTDVVEVSCDSPDGLRHSAKVSSPPPARQREGYVLMMVLVLLIVVATALSSIATRTMRTTQEASVAMAQLQQRIGMKSCRETFLLQAELIFKTIDGLRLDGKAPANPEGSRMAADAIVLGDQRFDLVLFDENSKVNLNTVFQNGGQQKVTEILRESLPTSIARAISLHPAAGAKSEKPSMPGRSSKNGKGREGSLAADSKLEIPESNSTSNLENLPAFRSWGEVFDFGMLISQNPDKQVQLDFAKSFTLWGSGQINIHRTTDTQLSTLAGIIVTDAQARKIVTKLRENPDPSIDIILEKEIEDLKVRTRLRNLLSPTSYSYSLFIDVDSPQCRSRKSFVKTLDPLGVQQILEFVFH